MIYRTLSASVMAMILLSGCANTKQAMEDNNKAIATNIEHTSAVKKGFATRNDDVVVLKDNGVWVSPQYVQVAIEKPAILSEVISISKGNIGLDAISEEITRRLGVSVRLGPEIIMSMKGAGTPGTSVDSSSIGTVLDVSSTSNQPTSPIDKSIYYTGLTYTGTLEGLLDVLSARMNVSWDIDKNGELKIYRYLTKTFVIAAPHGQSEFNIGSATQGTSSADSSSSGSEDGGTSGSSDITAKTSSTQSPWLNTADAVKAFLSSEGKAAVNESAGTITITDVKLVVDRVGEYVSQQNDNYLRQAAISVTVYSVESTDDIGYGVNWGVIYEKLTDYSLAAASPVGLLGAGAGSVSALILEDTTKTSSYAGTNALFEALRTQGNVTTVTSGSVLALNHRPSSIRLGLSEGYLKSSSTTTTANVGTTTALQDGTVDTGSVMALLPNIIDAERLTLQMTINISALIGQIKEFKSGGDSIFSPKKSIMEINYPVSLKSGQTLVLGGLEDNSANNNANSIADSPLLGGGERTQSKRSSIVIVVKSVIL